MVKYNVWYCHLCECRRRFYTEWPNFYSMDGLPVTKCSQGHDVDSGRYYKAQQKAVNEVLKSIYLEPISDFINNMPLLKDFIDPETS